MPEVPRDQLVSTIVPVHNGARYLAQAIGSVLDQTHPELEIIVVDDGSTDDSAAVAESFGSRVQLVRQENRGQAAALNTGLARATGDFVAFLDADDIWLAEKTARQLERFARRPDLAYCVTRIRNFLSPEFEPQRSTLDEKLFADAPGYVVTTLMARRSLFVEIGGFDERLRHANKTAWFLRARAQAVAGEEIPEVLAERRLHASNLSQKAARSSLDEYLGLVKATLDQRRSTRQ